MIYYLLALLLYSAYMAFVSIKIQDTRYKNLSHALVGMLPLFLLVVLRGEVGTDTSNYINIISQISAPGASEGIEFGFIYLVKALL